MYNDQGEAVKQQKGELVCENSFPNMPVGFWGDDDGQRYFNAYFARFDNIWAHGDFAELTEHGGVVFTVGRMQYLTQVVYALAQPRFTAKLRRWTLC